MSNKKSIILNAFAFQPSTKDQMFEIKMGLEICHLN